MVLRTVVKQLQYLEATDAVYEKHEELSVENVNLSNRLSGSCGDVACGMCENECIAVTRGDHVCLGEPDGGVDAVVIGMAFCRRWTSWAMEFLLCLEELVMDHHVDVHVDEFEERKVGTSRRSKATLMHISAMTELGPRRNECF